jgi:hypothetical protein
MGNNPTSGFQYGEGRTKKEAMESFKKKVMSQGGHVYCDDFNVCYTVDANGARFRIHITELVTIDGAPYYSVTEGVTF